MIYVLISVTFILKERVCVQGVFDHRMKTWQKWQDSQMLLQKKREAEAKLQFTNKPDKLQQAKDEIREVRESRTELWFYWYRPETDQTKIHLNSFLYNHSLISRILFRYFVNRIFS